MHILAKGAPMGVMALFVVFVFVNEAIAVGIASIVEKFNDSAGLMVFFVLFLSALWLSWIAAIWVAERYWPRPNNPQNPAP
jgi:low temperature requirement protein LtrA